MPDLYSVFASYYKRLPHTLNSEQLYNVHALNISDSPEVSLEETWKPNGDEFEVLLVCNVVSFPKSKVKLSDLVRASASRR